MTGLVREAHLARIAEVRAGTAAAKVGYPIGLRELEVLRTARLGPALVRITLGGDGAAGFESHVPEEHVRLIFPDEHGELRLPERDGLSLRWPRPLPVSREYTVRRHDPDTGELDIDIALHPGGLGADWAAAVAPGERIHVAGPPGGPAARAIRSPGPRPARGSAAAEIAALVRGRSIPRETRPHGDHGLSAPRLGRVSATWVHNAPVH